MQVTVQEKAQIKLLEIDNNNATRKAIGLLLAKEGCLSRLEKNSSLILRITSRAFSLTLFMISGNSLNFS